VNPSELVTRGTILRATVGSTVHGLHHGGQDDRDEMAVFIEPPEYRLGLRAKLTLVETGLGRELRGSPARSFRSARAAATSATCTVSASGCSGRAAR